MNLRVSLILLKKWGISSSFSVESWDCIWVSLHRVDNEITVMSSACRRLFLLSSSCSCPSCVSSLKHDVYNQSHTPPSVRVCIFVCLSCQIRPSRWLYAKGGRFHPNKVPPLPWTPTHIPCSTDVSFSTFLCKSLLAVFYECCWWRADKGTCGITCNRLLSHSC